jgi:hypothetical protein
VGGVKRVLPAEDGVESLTLRAHYSVLSIISGLFRLLLYWGRSTLLMVRNHFFPLLLKSVIHIYFCYY